MRMEQSNKTSMPSENIGEQRIKEITRKFVFDGHVGLDEKDLIFEVIKLIKCDLVTAKSILQKMKDLGMVVCHHWNVGYVIRRFADMRGYVTDDEFAEIDKKIEEKARKEDKREAQFIAKYGG